MTDNSSRNATGAANTAGDDSQPIDETSPGPELSAKGVRTRRRLVDAARRRFGGDALRSVSISAIAHDAGLTPAAVYAYFPNKEALFVAALDDEVTDWAEGGLDQDVQDRPVAAVFARLVSGLSQFPLVERTLRSGSSEHLQYVVRSTAMRRLTQTIEREIRQRQSEGIASADHDAAVLAVGVETIVFALLTTIVRTGLTGDERRLAGVLAIFDAALGHPTPATGPNA